MQFGLRRCRSEGEKGGRGKGMDGGRAGRVDMGGRGEKGGRGQLHPFDHLTWTEEI